VGELGECYAVLSSRLVHRDCVLRYQINKQQDISGLCDSVANMGSSCPNVVCTWVLSFVSTTGR
jgi:hypothetical protein